METSDLTLPSALESLNREDYKSDSAYMEAAADLEMKRSSPEFQKALQKTRIEFARRESDKQSKEQAALLEQEIKKTTLTDVEDRAIREKASGEVAEGLKSGRIETADMEREVSSRYMNYRKQEVQRKAGRNLANRTLRQALGFSEKPSQPAAIKDALHMALGG